MRRLVATRRASLQGTRFLPCGAVGPTRSNATAGGTTSGTRFLSDDRLQQFMEAELTHLRLNFSLPSPGQALSIVLALEEASQEELLKLILTEVPCHYAHRIGELELLLGQRAPKPDTQDSVLLAGACENSVALTNVRDMYRQSFFDLRKFEVGFFASVEGEDYDGLVPFSTLVEDLRAHHSDVAPQIAGSIVQTRLAHSDDHSSEFNTQLGLFYEQFFLSRAFTEMLMRQYTSVTQGSSMIERNVQLKEVCRRAFEDALVHVKTFSGSSVNLPEEAVFDGDDVHFDGLSQYVYFILFEVCKNSLKAYSQNNSAAPALPMRFTCAADDFDCAVRVSDSAGGIPRSFQPHIWTYAYSSSPAPHMTASGALHKAPKPPGFQRSPLAGWGCGLSNARLYACFMGGSLSASVLPGLGVDVLLDFARDVRQYAGSKAC